MSSSRSSSRPPIAAIDIGTNSVLLTIADVDGAGQLVIREQFATVTRLGQDVDRTKRLHPDAEERTLACLSDYRRALDRAGVKVARAVGTSALRDASGGEAFLERAEETLGFPVEVVSGAREAELTFFGALSGIELRASETQRDSGAQRETTRTAFVFDIGGGSTELIVGRLEDADSSSTKEGARLVVEQSTSLDIGSVRLTERVAPSDPPAEEHIAALRAIIRKALVESGIVVPSRVETVGVAGTVTTLFAIAHRLDPYDPALVHGQRIDSSIIDEWATRLGQMTLTERLALIGLSKGRADVIVAGALLCAEILSFAGANELIVSDRGVRFGLLREITLADQF